MALPLLLVSSRFPQRDALTAAFSSHFSVKVASAATFVPDFVAPPSTKGEHTLSFAVLSGCDLNGAAAVDAAVDRWGALTPESLVIMICTR
jgi:hypothetical protein